MSHTCGREFGLGAPHWISTTFSSIPFIYTPRSTIMLNQAHITVIILCFGVLEDRMSSLWVRHRSCLLIRCGLTEQCISVKSHLLSISHQHTNYGRASTTASRPSRKHQVRGLNVGLVVNAPLLQQFEATTRTFTAPIAHSYRSTMTT
jgi:hypothetical protein